MLNTCPDCISRQENLLNGAMPAQLNNVGTGLTQQKVKVAILLSTIKATGYQLQKVTLLR